MSDILEPDICVIGGGSGGLVVAAAAASFGVPVVLIEKGRMGGDCLNYGCVPSKALLAAGKHAHAIREAPAFGIDPGGMEVDFRRVNDRVRAVIAAIEPNDSVERFTAMGVKVIKAHGRFIDRNTVEAGGLRIRARRFVVATGSSPLVPPIEGLQETGFFTNETLFENRRRPAHLIVIGGGPIGLEMAQAHLRLGSRVTVLEGLKALGKDDPELAEIVVGRLRDEGLLIHEGASVVRVERRGKSGVRVHYMKDGAAGQVDGSDILVAVGRRSNVAGMGLDEARIVHNARGIWVRSDLRTSNRKVYAIGDVAGGLQFTHVAGYHAGLVIQSILFRRTARPDNSIVPWATYTDPELAHVGLSEAEARRKRLGINVLRWPFHENDRAVAEGKTAGMVKLVTDRKGRVLGASIAGANAGEMINLWALALSKGLGVRDLASYIPPYPTMTEAGKRAATSYYVPLARNPWIRKLIGFLRKFG